MTERASRSGNPQFPPQTLGSEGRIWGPEALVAGLCALGLALTYAVVWSRPAPRPPLPDVSAALTGLDAIEVHAIALTKPTDCDRAIVRARRAQRGAIVFVKGDACRFVRELPARPVVR